AAKLPVDAATMALHAVKNDSPSFEIAFMSNTAPPKDQWRTREYWAAPDKARPRDNHTIFGQHPTEAPQAGQRLSSGTNLPGGRRPSSRADRSRRVTECAGLPPTFCPRRLRALSWYAAPTA